MTVPLASVLTDLPPGYGETANNLHPLVNILVTAARALIDGVETRDPPRREPEN